MKIKKVEVEAFRAYQLKSDGTFDFTNDGEEPANFIALYAPNGFGKSSFYDAVEWAVTNHLERLGGEYNKANNLSAAKSTKSPNEGLKILRNKYADESVDTKVVVTTSGQNVFERKLSKIRKNQMDLRIGNDEKRENDFFRRVILSQDEIDRFLREAKPQERYSKFMESFGGDIETARKELSALINDNKSELSALNKKRKSLLEELKQPIDLSIFEQFNSVATELNSMGESIVLPDESLSLQTVHTLDANLVSRQHELNTSIHANSKMLEVLSERLNKIPEIELHVGYEIEQKTKLARLLKGVTDADKYKGLLDSYEKCVEEQKQANVRLNRLIEIAESAECFLQTELRLKEITKTKSALTEECSRLNAELAGFQKSLTELNNELKIDDDRVSQLRSSLDNSGPVYAELSNNRKRIDVLNQQITDRNNEIQVDKAQQDKLSRELSELSALKITSSFLLTGSMGVMAFEKEKIEQLGRCYAALDLLEVHNQTLHATQKALTEQMELHERLISIGLDYLSVEPSHICPLCTTPHSSPGELIDKVKSQNLLSELSQENSKKISQSSIREKELRGEIQEITQQAVESQAQQLTGFRNKLYEIEVKLAKAEQDKNTFEGESNHLEHRNAELERSVWGLSNQELVTRVEAELYQLSVKRPNLTQQQENLTAQIQVANESLKAKRVEYSKLESEMETKSSAHVYVSVLAYLNENAIAAQEINKHCEMKKNELNAVVHGYRTSCESLVSQCHDLQQEMIADGTWVDFSHLKKEKEALEVALTSSQSVVNAFYESLSNIISIRSDDTLEQVKVLITAKADDCQIRAHDLEKLLSGVKLLMELMTSFKPYIKHISTQKELEALEGQIERRNQVDEALVAERAVIIEKLEVLINNFFFEDLINAIYKKIDPHPTFKKVEFKVSFETEKPSLNILVSDGADGMISPILYFSAAQTNILSLSVFLANALHATDDEGNPIDVILIDDPIQSMDSINVLSTIDLLRSICLQFDKQLIISTHDENFFGLLQRKIPTEIFGAKFLQLKKFGVVVPVEPIFNS
ncbi:AAA family ATPase [Vibrio alginolyticus]|uniref:AAA family ATPase n=2 Tax=Vibrio harveyi group TaxID=717610 RepID=UPI001BD563E6|nr:AAA family ATPase [Vibrio alginolyticus]MBS9977791.1 AAA family ATPase [Vibrio alginolyticus]MCS0242951.1 AAA family ATPase [Vibrio alginolyticus]